MLDNASKEHWDLIIIQRTVTAFPPCVCSSSSARGESTCRSSCSRTSTPRRSSSRSCGRAPATVSGGPPSAVSALPWSASFGEPRNAAPPPQTAEAPAEDRYRTLVEEIPALIYVAWADDLGSRAYLSPQLQAMTGFKPVEWLAEPDAWARHLHPEDKEQVLREFRQSCAQGQTFLSEYRVHCRDDRIAWWHDQGRVVREADGRAKFVRGSVQDITEQKVAAETIGRR